MEFFALSRIKKAEDQTTSAFFPLLLDISVIKLGFFSFGSPKRFFPDQQAVYPL